MFSIRPGDSCSPSPNIHIDLYPCCISTGTFEYGHSQPLVNHSATLKALLLNMFARNCFYFEFKVVFCMTWWMPVCGPVFLLFGFLIWILKRCLSGGLRLLSSSSGSRRAPNLICLFIFLVKTCPYRHFLRTGTRW